MHPELAVYLNGVALDGDVRGDMIKLLEHHGCPKTAAHCLQVGAEARRLAQTCPETAAQVGLAASAETGGWLHDISAVVPTEQRVRLAESLGLEVFPGERRVPMILHQRLSASFAAEIFWVQDPALLSAIGCHTTLKPGASLLDKLVFLADKIAWDQPDEPPYRAALLQGLEISLDRAVFVYLDHLWQQRETLAVIHPWFAAAHQEFSIISAG